MASARKAKEPVASVMTTVCVTEHLLLAGQSMDMPVVFFVDPEMDKDRRYDNVRTITLSYTFFEAKTERAKTLLGSVAADATGKGG